MYRTRMTVNRAPPLPGHAEPLVKPGDRVRGGASIVARIHVPDADPLLAAVGAELLV